MAGKSNLLFKNTIYLYVRMILVLLVTLYTSRVILQTLGFDDFGIYNVVGSVVVFLSFLQNALNNASYRYFAYEIGTGNSEQLNRVYSMAINSHVLLAIILFVIMEIAGTWYINTYLNVPADRLQAANWVFQFSLLTFVLNIIRTPYQSNLIAHEQMSFYAILGIGEVLLKLAVVFVLKVIAFDKLISYAAMLTVVAAVVTIVNMIYCRVQFPQVRYRRIWDSALIKEFASYSGLSLVVNSADVCTQQSISIFFNTFIGVIGNAALGIANQVNAAIGMFVGNFTQALNPQIIKSYAAKDYDYFMRLLFASSKIAFTLFLVLAVPVLVNVEYILSIWLGEFPDHTPVYIAMIIVYYLFDSFQTPLMQAVHATGNLKTHQIVIGCLKVLTIPLAYFLLKFTKNGAYALLGWASINIMCALFRSIYMKYLIKMDIRRYFMQVWVKILLITASVVTITYIVAVMIENPLVQLLVTTAVSTILILVFSLVFLLDNNERSILNSVPVIGKLISRFNVAAA